MRAEAGRHIYIKGVTVRFGFDAIRTSHTLRIVKNKATETPHGCIIYSPLWLRAICSLVERRNYIHIYVGLSALLVSTIWAMREPTNRGTSIRAGSTFFYAYVKLNEITANLGVVGLFDSQYEKNSIFIDSLRTFHMWSISKE